MLRPRKFIEIKAEPMDDIHVAEAMEQLNKKKFLPVELLVAVEYYTALHKTTFRPGFTILPRDLALLRS